MSESFEELLSRVKFTLADHPTGIIRKAVDCIEVLETTNKEIKMDVANFRKERDEWRDKYTALQERNERLERIVEAALDFLPYLKYTTITQRQSEDRRIKRKALIAVLEELDALTTESETKQ